MKKNPKAQGTKPALYENFKARDIKEEEELKKSGLKKTKKMFIECEVWRHNGTEVLWNRQLKSIAWIGPKGTMLKN